MKKFPEKDRIHPNRGGAEPWTLWEIMHRARLLIITGSLIVPLVILSRAKIVQEYWDQANPTKLAERLLSSGAADPTLAPVLERACENSPKRVDLLRALAAASAMHDPARARRCYEQIDKLGATTKEDLANRALLMAHLNSFEDAEALLDSATPEQAASHVLLRARLAVKIQKGDIAGASQSLDALCLATLDDPDPALEIAATCVKSGADSSLIASAERHAISILSRWNKAGRSAELTARLEKLLDLPLQDAGSREAAHLLLTQLREPDPAQSMAATALERPASFSGREQEKLRSAYLNLSRKRGGISVGQKDSIADFLQHQGDHALVLQLIPTSESLTERALFQRRVSSLLHLGQWREVAELMGVTGGPTTMYNRSLFVALKTLNRAPVATSHTSELLLTALRDADVEGHAEACYAIGCAALEMNLQSVATDAFAMAIRLAPSDAQILDGILNAARRCRLPVKDVTVAIAHGLEGRRPSPLVAQRLCYLQLLERRNVEAVRQFIGGQRGGTLDPVYVRFLEALDHYQQGEFTESFRLLMPLPDYCWHQGETAVIIGILCSAGGADHCKPLAKAINPAILFPEERAMMEPWLSHLSLVSENDTAAAHREIHVVQR